jgi:ATP-dependent protease ClpP protease subunit
MLLSSLTHDGSAESLIPLIIYVVNDEALHEVSFTAELDLLHPILILIFILLKNNSILSPVSVSLPELNKEVVLTPLLKPEQVLEYIGTVSNATNEKIFAEVKRRMKKNPVEEICLTVTSTGGPSGAAMCFYEMMRSILRPKLTTIGIGDVDSSGVIIFLSGSRRLISRRTTMLLHLAGRRFDPNVRFTAPELEAMALEDRLKDRQYAEIISNTSRNLSIADVLNMMEQNTVLSPEQLLDYGLALGYLS